MRRWPRDSRRSPLRTDEAVRLGRDILRGLEASHAAGVARPGLRADAIICAPERAVLVDLGRALAESASVEPDLHAAAALLYEAVAGQPVESSRLHRCLATGAPAAPACASPRARFPSGGSLARCRRLPA